MNSRKKSLSVAQVADNRRFVISRALWLSLPPSCSGLSSGFPSVSLESVDFWSKFFGYGPGSFSLFLQVCRSPLAKEVSLGNFVALAFPCSLSVADAFPCAFKRLKNVYPGESLKDFGQCPRCFSWLWLRSLSGSCSPSNVFGFSSHRFCPRCFFEQYS